MYITIIDHNETWIHIDMIIPNIKQCYLISSYGRIFNTRTNKYMKLFMVPNGYYAVTLTFNTGQQKRFYIHRLVALAFIPNPSNKDQVNHLNGIKKDNYIENLEWCTSQENIMHAINTRMRSNLYGEKHPKNKYNKELIESICYLISIGKKPSEIISILNLSNPGRIKRLIKHIKRKEQWVKISNKYF